MNFAQIKNDTIVNIIIAENEKDALEVSNDLQILDVSNTAISIGWKKYNNEWRPEKPNEDVIWSIEYQTWLTNEQLEAINQSKLLNLQSQGCCD